MKRNLVLAAVAVAGGWIGASSALAVCRVVEPYEDSGTQPVTFDPTTAAVFVVAPDQIVDYDCPTIPGVEVDTTETGYPLISLAPRFDGALLSALGARVPVGVDFTAPEYDPSRCYDGTVGEPIVDTVIHTIIRPAIFANGGSAGLIMPIPTRGDVNVAPAELFSAVSDLQAAHIEETITNMHGVHRANATSDPIWRDRLDHGMGDGHETCLSRSHRRSCDQCHRHARR